jgi:truncated hemoglobin YjbI
MTTELTSRSHSRASLPSTKTMSRTLSTTWAWAAPLAGALLLAAGGCSSSNDMAGVGGSSGTGTGGATAGGTGGAGGAAQSLYDKYGGAATVAKVVDDAVGGVLADCAIVPYFAVVGQPGHDSAARIKSCLRLQFTALMGGPATYPGVDDMGDTCVDMKTIHTGLGIPGGAFDKFLTDLAGVLAADGVSQADITTLATALSGIKGDVVSPTPVEKTACDAGTTDAAGNGG